MADEPQPTHSPTVLRAVNWREVLPFTHLFRAFRVAVHPSKLVLGLLALLALYLGGRVMDAVWPQKYLANHGEVDAYAAHKGEGSYAGAIEEVRRANQQSYASLLGGLDERDKAISDAAKARDEAVKAAGTDTKKVREANDAYNEREAGILSRFNTAAAGRGGGASQGLLDAAKEFPRVGETKVRLNTGRDLALANAKRVLDTQEADANTIADSTKKQDALRSARQTYATSQSTAMGEASQQLRRLEQTVPRGLFAEFFEYQVNQVNGVANGALKLSWPTIIEGVHNFFFTGPAWLFRFHWLYAVLFFALFLVVWAVFGGAIARIAAVHVARDEKISVRQALRFSINKVLSFVFAPLIPLIIALGIGLVLAVGGLLFYVPWVGPIAAGALFFLALIAGVVVTLVLFGTVGGLNLMFPTIAVEGSDSFDAISRSFSYVFARPWRMAFYTLVAVVYGGVSYLFVRLFVFLVLSVTRFFVGWFLTGQPAAWYPEIWPASSPNRLPYDVNFAGLKLTEDLAAFLISFWVYLLIGLVGAFAISFYFSANTIIYYLMRREVDATELEDVYVEEAEDDLVDASAPSPATAGGPGTLPSAVTTPATIVGTTTTMQTPPVTPPTGGNPT